MDENIVKLKPKKGFEKVKRVAVPGKVYSFPPFEIEESEYPNVKKYFDIDNGYSTSTEKTEEKAPLPEPPKEKKAKSKPGSETEDTKKEKVK